MTQGTFQLSATNVMKSGKITTSAPRIFHPRPGWRKHVVGVSVLASEWSFRWVCVWNDRPSSDTQGIEVKRVQITRAVCYICAIFDDILPPVAFSYHLDQKVGSSVTRLCIKESVESDWDGVDWKNRGERIWTCSPILSPNRLPKLFVIYS